MREREKKRFFSKIEEEIKDGRSKEKIAKKAEITKGETKLTKSMSIAELIKAMRAGNQKSIARSYYTRAIYENGIVALNTTPKLRECTPISFFGSTDECGTAWIGAEHAIGTGISHSI